MHLLRCLLFLEAQRNCNLTPAYISTEANHLANDLSRDHLSSFFSKVPQANPHPTPVPRPSCTFYWTPQPTGLQKHGAVSSALLLAPSTQKTYSGTLKCFYLFCTRYSIINPYPLSEHLLCSFEAHLAVQGLSPQSIKTYLSAVHSVQISLT